MPGDPDKSTKELARPFHACHCEFTRLALLSVTPRCAHPRIPDLRAPGGHSTGDSRATTQSEDVTISPPKVCSSTDRRAACTHRGQELLSSKVRDARLEHSCHSATVVERRPQAEPATTRVPASVEVQMVRSGFTEVPNEQYRVGRGPTSKIDGGGDASSPNQRVERLPRPRPR